MKSRPAVWAVYFLGCGLVGFAALEIALRLYLQVPVFTSRDLRGLRGQLLQTSGAVYDPLLGWSQRSNFVSGGFDTLDYGIRKNSDEEEQLTQGSVLAVGDSFTAGSEVVNEDTWPAQLERALGIRVINAGVGGYGVDQAVLNAERLLPILKPRAVIVGIYEEDIVRVNYRSYNAPKPYFVEENGAWVHRNNPVPVHVASAPEPLYKRFLARFMTAHILLGRYRDYWYSGDGPGYELATNAPAKTTCYALERLQSALSPQNIPSIVAVQYGGWIYARAGRRPAYVDEVLRCARNLNYVIVDEFDQLSAIARASLPDLKQNYVMAGENVYGHMSAKGNALVASLIAEKLRASVDLRTLSALPDVPADLGDGTGINRIISARPETFIRAAVDLQPVDTPGPLPDEPVYRIAASAKNGEHYIVLRWSDPHPGPHTFSTFVRPSADNHVTIQILDNQGNGAVAHYSFPSGEFTLTAVGAAQNVVPHAETTPSGWLRISVSTGLTGRKGTAIVQISPQDPPSAEPGKLVVQGMMVEYGSRPSSYCRPRACKPTARAP
jgi:lysophospholipase L1-like esterase